MLNLPDKETRVRLGIHATFKSDIYRQYERTALFIESSRFQSEGIHQQTNKNVFCVENMTFYHRQKNNNDKSLKEIWKNLRKGW